MKSLSWLLPLFLALLQSARAQYAVSVVSDPIEQLAHTEDMGQWAQSIQALNTQITQFNTQIQQLGAVQSYIGNPVAAAGSMNLNLLNSGALSSSVGETPALLVQNLNGLAALQNTANGVFPATSLQTPSGFPITYNGSLFTPYAAIQQGTQNVTAVVTDTASRISALQLQKAATLGQIQSATNQSQIDMLQAQANAIDGQIAALNGQQSTAQTELVAQDIANRNDRKMKADAANQAADQEMSVSLDNYSQWQGQVNPSLPTFQ